MNEFALLIAAALLAGTPLALAGLGLLVNERAGVLNLGAEGMMLVAAVSGFAVALGTGSDTLIHYRLRWVAVRRAAIGTSGAAA